MPKKDSTASHRSLPENTKKHRSHTKILKLTTAAITMMAGIFSSNPSYNQTSTATNPNNPSNKPELFEPQNQQKTIANSTTYYEHEAVSQDSIDYEYIKGVPIKLIFKRYGNERGLEIIQTCVFKEINKIRKEFGLNEVSIDQGLTKASQTYAEYMNKNNRFNHTAKNGDDRTKRAKKAGYTGKKVDENIGWNFYSIEDGIKERRKSKPHFDNIKTPERKDVGIGQSGEYRVIMFGTP